MKIVAFLALAIVSMPAAHFIAGVYSELLGFNATPLGVMWGFFWVAAWFWIRPLNAGEASK